MKPSLHYIVITLLLLSTCTASAQTEWVDSVKKVSETQKEDTTKVHTLITISDAYQLLYPDSSFIYAQRAIELAEKLHFDRGIFYSEASMIGVLRILGNYPLQLEYGFKAMALAKKINEHIFIGTANDLLSDCYYNLGDYNTSLQYFREVIRILIEFIPDDPCNVSAGLSRIFNGMHETDSALIYAKKAYEMVLRFQGPDKESYDNQIRLSFISPIMGNAFAGKANYDSAMFYYRMGIKASTSIYVQTNIVDLYNGIAAVYSLTGHRDSAAWYSKKVLAEKITKIYPAELLKAVNMLAGIYEAENRADSSLKYLQIATALKDSLFNREKMIAVQNLTYREKEKQREAEASAIELQNRFRLYFLLAAGIALLVITAIVIRNRRQKQLQAMRNSIADDLHDDIGSTLSSISIMSELAKEKSPQALSLLESIGESATSLQENMSDIVWAINAKNDRFENVLERMVQFASEILDAKNIELDFTNDTSLTATRLTMGQRKNFYLFFKEVINNAAKYSEAKKIVVNISRKGHHIEMNIRDNGKGFDPVNTVSGNGMYSLKKRGAELSGYFNIESQINKGTAVQLKFKIT